MTFTMMHGCGNDFMAERVTVGVPGGDLFVRPRTFELAGPAEYVFGGSTA